MRQIDFCCDRFKKQVKKNKIILKEIKGLPTWLINGKIEVYHCPFCGKFADSGFISEDPHFDFSSSPKKELLAHVCTERKPIKYRVQYCCSRFESSVKEGEFSYAYKYGNEIDETQWVITGWYHLYYCPFCGKYIKGRGFGIAPKPYK